MQDSDEADRPQRHSAMVVQELDRLDIDIAALSRVRFAEERVTHRARSRTNLVLVWKKQGGLSPVRSRLRVEEHAGQ